MTDNQHPVHLTLDTKLKWVLSCAVSFALGFGVCMVWWHYDYTTAQTFKSALDALDGKAPLQKLDGKMQGK